jgi:hypothetical protein
MLPMVDGRDGCFWVVIVLTKRRPSRGAHIKIIVMKSTLHSFLKTLRFNNRAEILKV